MAFEAKNKEIRQALGNEKTAKITSNIKFDNRSYEIKKQYQFMLYPSHREKLNTIAIKKGYRSASALLDDIIENL